MSQISKLNIYLLVLMVTLDPDQVSMTSYEPWPSFNDKLWTMTYFQWQVMDPDIFSVTSYRPPVPIPMTDLGRPDLVSMTSLWHPSLVLITIGTTNLRNFLKRDKNDLFQDSYHVYLDPEVVLLHIFQDVSSVQCRVPLSIHPVYFFWDTLYELEISFPIPKKGNVMMISS